MEKKEESSGLFQVWGIVTVLILATRELYDDVNKNSYTFTTIAIIVLFVLFIILLIGQLKKSMKGVSDSQKKLRDQFR